MANSNREIRALTEGIYTERKSDLSGSSRGFKASIRSGLPHEENEEILKAHYENNVEELNELKIREK